MTRVAIAGHGGRVGRALVPLLQAERDIDYAGGVGREDDLGAFLRRTRPDVLVDFTHPGVALHNALAAVAAGATPVVGTSGLKPEDVARLATACQAAGLGGIVAPNFAIGAVVMVWLAERAAPYFEAVEVVEAHHATKADAPSGTALATARAIAAANPARFAAPEPERVTVAGTRGGIVDGVAIHSLRLPGVVADQEVVFGLPGQTLSIAHRTTSRDAFGPGVLLAIRRLREDRSFYDGLGALLGLR
ncbi:MAG: 4-hydroxy-tetrahydrodipicolinate reductase [Candidatus Dormiibacterota bacterium]